MTILHDCTYCIVLNSSPADCLRFSYCILLYYCIHCTTVYMTTHIMVGTADLLVMHVMVAVLSML